MSALVDSSKTWHIVLRCTICGPLGLLFASGGSVYNTSCSVKSEYSEYWVSSHSTYLSFWLEAQTPRLYHRTGSRKWWIACPGLWAWLSPCGPGSAAHCCPGPACPSPWTWWSPSWEVWGGDPYRSRGNPPRCPSHCMEGTAVEVHPSDPFCSLRWGRLLQQVIVIL